MREPSKIISEAKAGMVLNTYGLQSPSDLVLEDLAFALGVLVIEGPLKSSDARLIRKGTKGIIRIKQDIVEPGRKRFAISHEIGHWLLHPSSNQLLACTDLDMLARYKGSPTEVEANYFASELLMPRRFFSTDIQNREFSSTTVKDLADKYQTSRTATAIRYVEITDDYCAVVISHAGKVKWWRASEQMERFWIKPNAPLEHNCLAAEYFRSRQTPGKPQEVDSDAWIESSSFGETILEDIIPLPRYNDVISLLRIP